MMVMAPIVRFDFGQALCAGLDRADTELLAVARYRSGQEPAYDHGQLRVQLARARSSEAH